MCVESQCAILALRCLTAQEDEFLQINNEEPSYFVNEAPETGQADYVGRERFLVSWSARV